jgi:tRNA 2-thiocytidine biosynthesis protein TtcA
LPKHSYKYKAVKRFVGKALHKYDMIADGDRVLVGLSGGKDSLTLMWALNERRARIPIDYDLFPVYIDPGFEGGFSGELAVYARQADYGLRIEHTDYGVLAHSETNRENPCFLCARLRRKRLFEIAEELGCNKVALGHHKDDIIETLLMNMCYAGEISTMIPSQSFFKGLFTLIRPLTYLDEDMIRKFAAEMNFPRFVNPCPSSNASKRQEIKSLLHQLYRSNRKIKGNLFRALGNVRTDYLLQ